MHPKFLLLTLTYLYANKEEIINRGKLSTTKERRVCPQIFVFFVLYYLNGNTEDLDCQMQENITFYNFYRLLDISQESARN